MPDGSCSCGKISVQVDGEPIAIGICHCADCRKLTGAPFSYCFIVKTSDLNVTGNPLGRRKDADSGSTIENFHCADCGTPIYGHNITAKPTGTVVLRAGILNDEGYLNEHGPTVELYVKRRLKWVPALEGAAQFEGFLPPQ